MGYSLGVDLGTTYTAAAIIRDGRSEMAVLGTKTAAVPTIVSLGGGDEPLIGEAARRRLTSDPASVAREFKRRIGDSVPIMVGGAPRSAESLLAVVLRWVVERVAEQEGALPDHTVVTFPANWGPYRKELLDQAIRQSDVARVSTTTEPEAAAVHYASVERVEPGELVAVYDLGGGTFDAALLRRTASGFELQGVPEGIEHLGGIDVDEAVFAHVRRAVGPAIEALDPDDPATLRALYRLREECTEAKEALSFDAQATVPVLLPGVQTDVVITRPELELMIRPMIADTIAALGRAFAAAGLTPDAARAVLLVGGSSRIPLVAEMITAEFGRPVAVDTHPKHAVALGAALMAASRAAPAESVPAPPPATEPAVTEPVVAPATPVERLIAEPAPTDPAPPDPAPTELVPTEPVPTERVVAATRTEPVVTTPASASPPETHDLRRAPSASRSRTRLFAAIAAAIVVIVVGAVLLVGGGDGGGDGVEASGGGSTTTAASETTTTATTATPTTVQTGPLLPPPQDVRTTPLDSALTDRPLFDPARVRIYGASYKPLAFDLGNLAMYSAAVGIESNTATGAALANDLVYVGDDDGVAYAFSAETLEPVWQQPVAGGVYGTPVVSDTTAFYGTDLGNLYGFDAVTGAPTWGPYVHVGPIYVAPALAGDVIVVAGGDEVHAVDIASGTRKWRLAAAANAAPTVVGNVVYVATTGQELVAIDLTTGREDWRIELDSSSQTQPVIADGVVYVGTAEGALTAVSAVDGEEVWVRRTGGNIAAAALVADGLVYVGSADANVYAFTTEGALAWVYPTDGPVESSSVLAQGVLVLSTSTTLYGIVVPPAPA